MLVGECYIFNGMSTEGGRSSNRLDSSTAIAELSESMLTRIHRTNNRLSSRGTQDPFSGLLSGPGGTVGFFPLFTNIVVAVCR